MFVSSTLQEKRLERQNKEAKVHRREAARRRTRDLLLNRAKQRLLAVTTGLKAAGFTGRTVPGGKSGVGGIEDEVSGCSSGKDNSNLAEEVVGEPEVPLYAQETWAARRSKVWRPGKRST